MDFPLQQAQVFLIVALQPGLTMQDLSDRTGMAQSSCSRNVAALSKWHRLGKPGMDYVEASEDPRERRRKIMHLTATGKQKMLKVLEALRGEPVMGYAPPTAKEALAATR